MAGLQRGGDTNLFHEVAELTAGHETALNRYGDCDAVVFAGLLTLPHDAVAARVFAHSRDIKRELSSEELVKVVQSERVHSLYQALSRGSCRIMNNGKALKMDAYVFFNDYRNIKEALGVAMPSVKFAEYPTKHIKNKTTKKDECKIVFTKVLSEHGRNTISIKELNAHAPNVSSDTKEDALSELLGDIVGFDWQRQKRSLIRLGVN